MEYFYKTVGSPVGNLRLIASEEALVAILWEQDTAQGVPLLDLAVKDKNHPMLLETEKQLENYFAGNLKNFFLKLHFMGTEFQKKVWQALLTIPYGETRTYGEIAKQIENPKAVRAVGAASGKNPIAIIAPCHRVIGSNGKLTGFAGGLQAKAYLLELELNGL